mmetsp:Transcript_24096/g.60702  ORF Transcript_24096/g.60702 Transcript_24096/m.60702 type:complete len:1081 (+) Transcript_24096:140-3382(+)|eukprot:CAMPEP_0179000306 /NCGR_PEP_ID=MMETSP0795-20121207/10585_1 /TAXON_ID=88552 /ORGANISM="Amoebophrya sp., Strain Ameob2" /LENGTH=1080 /DNA_ID=CAMNT_0020693261 /DNA_START=120 /DNA_END=3362 /DNA_ORIENTATION=-
MDLDLERLLSQLEGLRRDELMFEFICEQTFENYKPTAPPASRPHESAYLTLPQIAPLIENLLRAQGREASYREVHGEWRKVCDPDGHCMRFPAFHRFVAQTLRTLEELIRQNKQAEALKTDVVAMSVEGAEGLEEEGLDDVMRAAEIERARLEAITLRGEPRAPGRKTEGTGTASSSKTTTASEGASARRRGCEDECRAEARAGNPQPAEDRFTSSPQIRMRTAQQKPASSATGGHHRASAAADRCSLDLESLTSEISVRISAQALERHKRQAQQYKMAQLAKPKQTIREQPVNTPSAPSSRAVTPRGDRHTPSFKAKSPGLAVLGAAAVGSRSPNKTAHPHAKRGVAAAAGGDGAGADGVSVSNAGLRSGPTSRSRTGSTVHDECAIAEGSSSSSASIDGKNKKAPKGADSAGSTSARGEGPAANRKKSVDPPPGRPRNPSRLLREFGDGAGSGVGGTQAGDTSCGAGAGDHRAGVPYDKVKEGEMSGFVAEVEDKTIETVEGTGNRNVPLRIEHDAKKQRSTSEGLRGCTENLRSVEAATATVRRIRDTLLAGKNCSPDEVQNGPPRVFCDPDLDPVRALGLSEVAVPAAVSAVRWRQVEYPTEQSGLAQQGNNAFAASASASLQQLRSSEMFGDSWLAGAVGLAQNAREQGGVLALQAGLCDTGLGIFVFRFFKNGHDVFVIVDGFCPFCREGVSGDWSAFGATVVEGGKHSPAASWWLYLLEKAYAKLFGGCYPRLSSGFPDEALTDLLHFPVQKIAFAKKTPDAIWSELTGSAPSTTIGCIKTEAGHGRSSAQMGDARFVHVEGEKFGLRPGLVNTGVLRNCMYAVTRLSSGPLGGGAAAGDHNDSKKQRFVELRRLFEDDWERQASPAWRAKVLKASALSPGAGASALTLAFEDWLLLFSSAFVVLEDKPLRQRLQNEWTPESCGGTPIPIKRPVYGSTESWARNPQHLTSGARSLLVLLQQEDPRPHLAARFPFADQLEEIFVCALRARVDTDGTRTRFASFDKSAVVRDGGMSLIVQRRDVLMKVTLEEHESYILVPSTWKTGQARRFSLSFYCQEPGFKCELLQDATAPGS